jgi:hypothetical protein
MLYSYSQLLCKIFKSINLEPLSVNLPAYALGLVYSLLIGSLFHVWRDGGSGRLLFHLALSVSGAAAGQWIGSKQGWILFPVGAFNLGLVTAGSIVLVNLGHWLSLVDIHRSDTDG